MVLIPRCPRLPACSRASTGPAGWGAPITGAYGGLRLREQSPRTRDPSIGCGAAPLTPAARAGRQVPVGARDVPSAADPRLRRGSNKGRVAGRERQVKRRRLVLEGAARARVEVTTKGENST